MTGTGKHQVEEKAQAQPAHGNIDHEVPDATKLAEIQHLVQHLAEENRTQLAVTELASLRPPDRAAVLEGLNPRTRGSLIAEVHDDQTVAEAFEHIDPGEAANVFEYIGPDRMAAILDCCPPEIATDILHKLPWEQAGAVLGKIKDRKAVGDLLLYRDDKAGGLMSPRIVTLLDSWPAAHAINVLRYSGLDPEEMMELFVVDSQNVLVGALHLSDLVFAEPGAAVEEIMSQDVISVETGVDQEEAARLMDRYEVRSLPVVDSDGALKGSIAIEELVHVARDEATEDMYRMVGVTHEEHEAGRFMAAVRGRLPWLTINLGTVLLAGWVLSLFQSTLDSLTILTIFLPVVMGQAGIAGAQTLTITVRSIALGELAPSGTHRMLAIEAALALCQGLAVGTLLAAIVWAWRGDHYLALIVAAALIVNMIVAAMSGVLVPLLLRTVRIDPATSSAVFVTTLTDVVGIAAYLGLATAFLSAFNPA